jgi:hypothetical protein
MKSLSKILLVLVFSTSYAQSYHLPLTTSPEAIVQIVLQRLYLIERLHKPLTALFHLNADHSTLHHHLCSDTMFCDFEHPTIKDGMHAIQKHGNLKPLARIWKAFSSYRAIEDTLLAQELTKAIYVVARQLCESCHRDGDKDIDSMEELLNEIDRYIEQLSGKQKDHGEAISNRYLPDVHLEVQAENVVERFYCIQRTTKIKNLIEKVAREYPFLFSNYTIEKKENGVSIDGIMFTHPGIVEKIMRIDQTHIPFIGLSHDFERYKYIGDYAFTHGYLLSLLSACRHIQKEAQPTTVTKDLPDNVSDAALEQLLDAIDYIIDTLPDILEKYEFNNEELTWKMWLRKYWWAPTVIGASIGLRLWIALYSDA